MIYQILINNILAEYLDIYTVIYLNNIIIYLKDLKKYRKHIKIVLKKPLVKNLRYKLKKYEFHKTEIDFLRFLIRIERIKINPIKIKVVKEWLKLRNLIELQRFLGFGNFNRRFIKNYSTIILLFMELTKKNVSFI